MNKAWKNDNYIKKIEEASEGFDLLEDLVHLIQGEAVAAVQYQFAADSILGPDQSYLVDHFTEHASEEWGHYSQLVAALMQRGGIANLSLVSAIKDANPQTEELTSDDSEYLRDFFERAEDNAIKAYQDFYDNIADTDADLADIISGIISDERDHKLDFSRIK